MTTRGPIRYATSRDGTRIAWTSWGTGPSVIFVPPWPETIESGFVRHTLRQAFGGRIVSYDRRGFGLSDWGVEHGLDQYADDLEAVADAAGIDLMTLYGAAAGTIDSIVLAARSPRVKKMVLVEPAFRVGRDDLTTQKSLYALLDHDFATFWRAFLQFAIGWGEAADIEAWVRYFVSATNPADIRALLKVLLDRADLSEFAPLVRAECLILHNADDPMMPHTAAADLARLIPNHRLVIRSGKRWARDDAVTREAQSFLANGFDETERPTVRGGPRKVGGDGWRTLTPREIEVLNHAVSGATNEEIAAALWLSRATVARHLANVYSKLGVRNRVEASAWANEHARDRAQ
ncbi:MAG: alpha/beta hydrolase [Dehalococcoidia bacterium]|nr:alpha/beta hydrolase [Dehalococcoidia bacterium]